jgi:hypothetical protein
MTTLDELTWLDEQCDLMEALGRRDCQIDREVLRDLIVTARLARRLSGQPAITKRNSAHVVRIQDVAAARGPSARGAD